METCSSSTDSKPECNGSSCPRVLSDPNSDPCSNSQSDDESEVESEIESDIDIDSDSDIDMEPPEPVYQSNIPRFGTDLECFEKVSPSLMDALNNAGDAFATGWLAGCLHDVMTCLAVHLTNNNTEFPRRRSRLLQQTLEMRYHRFMEDDDSPASEGVIEWIKPRQLLDFYNVLHEAVEARHPPPSDVPLTRAQIEKKIDEKESMFGEMLDNAIQELWGEDENNEEESHEELYSLRGGWIYARDGPWTYPAWVQGTTDLNMSVQLTPDNTPIEYMPVGASVPMSTFSFPYCGPIEGTCLICMEELSEIGFKLVAARCTSGHVFHDMCLDHWVNRSGMKNANLCPYDREQICDSRPRAHPGQAEDMTEGTSNE